MPDVAGFLATLDDPRRDALAELCRVVEGADPRIEGAIKWNAPSYFIGEHFATTGLERRGGLRLVLHTGAKKIVDGGPVTVYDPSDSLAWKAPDRAILTFTDLADVQARRSDVQSILRQWIAATR
ncbi:MAG: DUF1801 domain-containing protein [Rhodococcus sp. (in: high G+C Gram-positive bacteria)]